MVCHSALNVRVDPVKCRPAKNLSRNATSLTAWPSPVTRLITPGGRPASSSRRMVKCAASCWVGEGFHSTVLPISAGASGRLPAIAVKLNGVIATTNPSSGRWSIRFHTPGLDIGLFFAGCGGRSGR